MLSACSECNSDSFWNKLKCVITNTLTLQMTLSPGFLPAGGSTIVFGHLDRTTCVFNTGGTPDCLLMQWQKTEAAVTTCSLNPLTSYWKPVRQTGTMNTLPAASSSCPWSSESKLSSTVWPLLLCWMMGLFSWTLKTVSAPEHPGKTRSNHPLII